MANDLVVNLALDYSNYQQGMQSSIAHNARFGTSVKAMAAQMQAAQNTIKNASSFREGSSGFDRHMRVGRTQAVSDLAVQQADNRLLAAQMQDSSLQATMLSTSIERLRQEELQLANANQQTVAAMSSQEAQEASLAVTTQRLSNELTRLRSSNMQSKAAMDSSAVSTLAASTAYENVIASAMQSRQENRNLTLTQQALNRAHKEGAITLAEYKSGMASVNATLAGKASGAGRAQMAMSQLIFAVDDATTVYGTTGLSGAVRAASNNLTMMASLMGGPWALGAAVAVSAATQLYLTFSKTSDAGEKASNTIKDFTTRLNDQTSAIARNISFRHQLQDLMERGDASAGKDATKDAARELESLNQKAESLGRQVNNRRRTIAEIDAETAQRQAEYDKRSDGNSLWVMQTAQFAVDYMAGKAINRSKERAQLAGELAKYEEEQLKVESERTEKIREQNALLIVQKDLFSSAANMAKGSLKQDWFDLIGAAQNESKKFKEQQREAATKKVGRLSDVRNEINDQFLSDGERNKRKEEYNKKLSELNRKYLDEWRTVDESSPQEVRAWEKRREELFKERSLIWSEQSILDSSVTASATKDYGKRREIAATLRDRIAAIEEMDVSTDERRRLRKRAEKLATREWAETDSKAALEGPSGFAKDSKEVGEIMRRAMQSQHVRKDKSEEHLAEINEEMKRLNTTAAKEKEAVEKMVKNSPTPIKLTP